jgi:predicted amidohydrolase
MKISLVQIQSGKDKQSNFEKAKKYILEAVKQKSDIICFSENFLYRGDGKEGIAEKVSSNFIKSFQKLAKDNNVNLILGSIALKTKINKITNSSLIVNRSGKIIHRYNKIYMYDVERENLTYRESDKTVMGRKLGLFKLDGIKMGVGICVDLRYPEYFRKLIKSGAEIIFLPSNFRIATGKVAWDVLTKARAIENQVYFCACGQTGGEGIYKRCGNSRIVSFEGQLISKTGFKEGIITTNLDLDKQKKFRKEFPVLKQIK